MPLPRRRSLPKIHPLLSKNLLKWPLLKPSKCPTQLNSPIRRLDQTSQQAGNSNVDSQPSAAAPQAESSRIHRPVASSEPPWPASRVPRHLKTATSTTRRFSSLCLGRPVARRANCKNHFSPPPAVTRERALCVRSSCKNSSACASRIRRRGSGCSSGARCRRWERATGRCVDCLWS